jgi:hypothetical protein
LGKVTPSPAFKTLTEIDKNMLEDKDKARQNTDTETRQKTRQEKTRNDRGIEHKDKYKVITGQYESR